MRITAKPWLKAIVIAVGIGDEISPSQWNGYETAKHWPNSFTTSSSTTISKSFHTSQLSNHSSSHPASQPATTPGKSLAHSWQLCGDNNKLPQLGTGSRPQQPWDEILLITTVNNTFQLAYRWLLAPQPLILDHLPTLFSRTFINKTLNRQLQMKL